MIEQNTDDQKAPSDLPDSALLIDQFQDSFDNTSDERADSEQARDYYDGYQLTDAEQEALRKRGQPVVISNRIAPKVDALLGQEKRMRTDPRAFPRTPKHEDEANSITDALRFVCESNNFDAIRSDVAENLMIEGIGAATVTVKPDDEGKMEVVLTWVPWDRFYRDPHSRRRDFKDAEYMGVVLWMDEADAMRRFKGKDDVISGCYAEGVTVGDTFDDRPSIMWGDRKRKRIRVLQHRFKHQGEWWTCVVCKGGYLRDPQVSPYQDEHGEPVCDLIPISAYIDRQNRRYGVVKRHISPQDEINKRRSKALHLLNTKQLIIEKGAVDDIEQTRREAARPDGVMQPNPGMKFEVISQNDLVSGQFQLLQESKGEIDITGVNPALSGDQQAPSGRSQEIQISSALAEYSGIFDSLKHWSWEVYRHIWYRIRQFWTEERWIRVTDDERNMRWVALNKPILQGHVWQQQGIQFDPRDPMAMQQVGVQNQLAELDVDIILEDAPHSVTIESEQFQALIDLKKIDPTAIPTKAIIQASQLRNKDQILAMLDQPQVPPQVQQQMQDLQQQLQDAQQKLQSVNTDQQKNQIELAKHADEHQFRMRQLELQIYEAETARIAAMKAVNPQVLGTVYPIQGISGDASMTPPDMSQGQAQPTPMQ
ncbi:hypothetical protein ACO2Q2_16605 [Dyella sp. KRB-257]|uniref:portal protein n=1 Tax=Dyella sp. KRB-257 TaxID=3400915 RepID=UPI003BFF2485